MLSVNQGGIKYPVSKVFAIGLDDRGSISGRVIQHTQKMVLDASFLNPEGLVLQYR